MGGQKVRAPLQIYYLVTGHAMTAPQVGCMILLQDNGMCLKLWKRDNFISYSHTNYCSFFWPEAKWNCHLSYHQAFIFRASLSCSKYSLNGLEFQTQHLHPFKNP